MKKLIIATVVAGFISLSFTIVNTPAKNKIVSKTQNSEKIDVSHKLNEKELQNIAALTGGTYQLFNSAEEVSDNLMAALNWFHCQLRRNCFLIATAK